MLSSVAVLAYEGVSTFGLGVTAEIFGCDRSSEGLPRYDYTVTAEVPGVIRTDVGLPVTVEAGLGRLSAADLGIVVCWDQTDTLPPTLVLEALRTIAERGGRVLSQCTGAFILAAAGLLDGRRATTHWPGAGALARRYPSVDCDPRGLSVGDGPVVPRPGTTADQWLISQRLMRAQELLEHPTSSIEQVASECGLTPLMLRRHFARKYETTPRAYRRTFSQAMSSHGPASSVSA